MASVLSQRNWGGGCWREILPFFCREIHKNFVVGVNYWLFSYVAHTYTVYIIYV